MVLACGNSLIFGFLYIVFRLAAFGTFGFLVADFACKCVDSECPRIYFHKVFHCRGNRNLYGLIRSV